MARYTISHEAEHGFYWFTILKDGEEYNSVSVKANNPEPTKTAWELAFPGNHNGYPGYWVGDGFVLCHRCGIDAVSNPENEDHDGIEYVVDWSYSDNPSSYTCDACDEYVYPPFCVECGNDESETVQLESNDSGNYRLCRSCIARALWETKSSEYDTPRMSAELVAPNVYRISGIWADGLYGRKAGEYAYAQWEQRRNAAN